MNEKERARLDEIAAQAARSYHRPWIFGDMKQAAWVNIVKAVALGESHASYLYVAARRGALGALRELSWPVRIPPKTSAPATAPEGVRVPTFKIDREKWHRDPEYDHDERQELRRRIDRLPGDLRRPLLLHLQEWPTRDIALRERIVHRTAQRRIRRAKLEVVGCPED